RPSTGHCCTITIQQSLYRQYDEREVVLMKNKRRQPALKTLSLAYRTIGSESKWIQAGSKGIHPLWSSGFQREG
ncbi:MAG TPA: hypothetical protein VFT30_12065, partial [Nitrospira sp.]|nr:hypothetical protein [Nitrospira sp.]